jgi:hypothetical protein
MEERISGDFDTEEEKKRRSSRAYSNNAEDMLR